LTQAGLHPDALGSEELFGEFGGGLRVVPLATEDAEVDGIAVFREMGRDLCEVCFPG
jgi:hypothetical protein